MDNSYTCCISFFPCKENRVNNIIIFSLRGFQFFVELRYESFRVSDHGKSTSIGVSSLSYALILRKISLILVITWFKIIDLIEPVYFLRTKFVIYVYIYIYITRMYIVPT